MIESKFPLSSTYLSTFFTIPILPFEINNFLIYLVHCSFDGQKYKLHNCDLSTIAI